MGVFDILAQIDREISQLKQARALLEASHSASASRATARKRQLTPEGRKRIVEAVKRRWALQKKTPIIEATTGWVPENQSVNHVAYQSAQL